MDPWPNQLLPIEETPATQAILPDGTPPFHEWRDDELFKLPQGRVFNFVEARVPLAGETPKLELVSGDLNSLAYQLPVVRRVWELILRSHNMITLPVSVRDATHLIPPERFWNPERVKEMKEQWGKWDSSETRAAVSSEYPDDEGMRALMWYDCMAIATRTDRPGGLVFATAAMPWGTC